VRDLHKHAYSTIINNAMVRAVGVAALAIILALILWQPLQKVAQWLTWAPERSNSKRVLNVK